MAREGVFSSGSLRPAVALIVVLVIGLLVGCSTAETEPAPEAEPTPSVDLPSEIKVVAAGSGLPQVIAGINAGALNAAGIPATVVTKEDLPEALAALRSGKADLLVAPTGEIADIFFTSAQESSSPSSTPTASLDTNDLDETLTNLGPILGAQQLNVLPPSQASDGLVFVITQARSDGENLTSLSDLATFSQQTAVQLGAGPGCDTRPACLPFLVDDYGVEIAGVTEVAEDKVPGLVGDRSVTVGQVRSVDPEIDELRLVILLDDLIAADPQNLVPLVSDSVNVAEVTDPINRVQEVITTQDLRDLNLSLAKGTDPFELSDSWVTTQLTN